MKNKKYIWLGAFVLSILLLTYSYKDIKLYYYVKMGNKNYYSKNYEKAIEYYEKALKIKEDYNIRINLIITDYQMKNYKKVLESPVENGFLKGNSLVLLSEKNPDNTEDLKKSLEYYKKEILTNDDINIKKNYEILEKKLKEQQQNQNNDNSNNSQQNDKNSSKDKDLSQNSDKNNNDSQNNNQQNKDQNNNIDNKNNQQNQNNNDNQKQNDSQQDLDKNNQKSQNSNQQQNQNSNGQPQKNNQQTKQQKELQAMLKNLEKNEIQSFKNNERLIGVENESDTKNRW